VSVQSDSSIRPLLASTTFFEANFNYRTSEINPAGARLALSSSVQVVGWFQKFTQELN
jgi:hypothetical protein